MNPLHRLQAASEAPAQKRGKEAHYPPPRPVLAMKPADSVMSAPPASEEVDTVSPRKTTPSSTVPSTYGRRRRGQQVRRLGSGKGAGGCVAARALRPVRATCAAQQKPNPRTRGARLDVLHRRCSGGFLQLQASADGEEAGLMAGGWQPSLWTLGSRAVLRASSAESAPQKPAPPECRTPPTRAC